MTTYIIAPNGVYDRHAESGNIAFASNVFQPASTLSPKQMTEFGVHRLVEVEKPSFHKWAETCTEGEPVFANGVWTQTWDVVSKTGDALAASIVDRKAQMKKDVMTLRDEKISGGISFGGNEFQTRRDDRENIAGAASLAAMALTLGGKQPGDLLWHGPDDGETEFAFIAQDNSEVPMDAPTVIAFGKATARHKSACIFYAKYIKGLIDAVNTHAELDDIDITVGWPA